MSIDISRHFLTVFTFPPQKNEGEEDQENENEEEAVVEDGLNDMEDTEETEDEFETTPPAYSGPVEVKSTEDPDPY